MKEGEKMYGDFNGRSVREMWNVAPNQSRDEEPRRPSSQDRLEPLRPEVYGLFGREIVFQGRFASLSCV